MFNKTDKSGKRDMIFLWEAYDKSDKVIDRGAFVANLYANDEHFNSFVDNDQELLRGYRDDAYRLVYDIIDYKYDELCSKKYHHHRIVGIDKSSRYIDDVRKYGMYSDKSRFDEVKLKCSPNRHKRKFVWETYSESDQVIDRGSFEAEVYYDYTVSGLDQIVELNKAVFDKEINAVIERDRYRYTISRYKYYKIVDSEMR